MHIPLGVLTNHIKCKISRRITYKPFLKRVQEKFGDIAVNNIKNLTKIKLKRKIVDNFIETVEFSEGDSR